jgi:hypothetical protein
MGNKNWNETVYGKRVETPDKGIMLFRHRDKKKIIRSFGYAVGGWGNTATFPDKNGKLITITPLGLPTNDNPKDPLGIILTERDAERLGITIIED